MTEQKTPAATARRRRRSGVTAVLLTVAGAAVLGTVAFSAMGSDGEGDQAALPVEAYTPPPGVDPGCAVPADDGSKLWVSGDLLDEVAGKLDAELTERFGPAAGMPAERLENGLIGQPVDYAGHRIVVVVDDDKIDPADLQDDLQDLAEPEVPIEVRAGCHPSDEIRRAMQAVEKVDWHPDAGKLFGYFVDDYTSTVRVETPAGPALDALRSRLADLDLTHVVVVREGVPTL